MERVFLWLPSQGADRETFPLHVVHHSHFSGFAFLEANGTDQVIVRYMYRPCRSVAAAVFFPDGGNMLLSCSDHFVLEHR
jgi:hypothetical protein